MGADGARHQEQNRDNVRDIPVKLARVGYRMIPARSNQPRFEFPDEVLELLAEMEHERWLRMKLRGHWRWGRTKIPEHKTRPDLRPWKKLSGHEKAEHYGVTGLCPPIQVADNQQPSCPRKRASRLGGCGVASGFPLSRE
jgi:hypothetical protein